MISDLKDIIDSGQTSVIYTHPETKKVYKVLILPANEVEKKSMTEWLGPVGGKKCPHCGKAI